MKPSKRNFSYHPVLCALVVPWVTAVAAEAQDDHLDRTPTDHLYYTSTTESVIRSASARGFRLIDLERIATRTPTYAAAFVRNQGAYARSSWWYPQLTATEVTSHLVRNGARLTDLEPFFVNGVLRFGAVMSQATRGDTARGFWTFDKTFPEIQALAQRYGARIIDLDRYEINPREHRFSAVMIENVGVQMTGWRWALNQTPASLQTLLNTWNMRAYDLDRTPNGQINCIAVDSGQRAAGIHHFFDLTEREIAAKLTATRSRLVDIEPRPNNRFDIVVMANGGYTSSFGGGCRGSNRQVPIHSIRSLPAGSVPKIGNLLSFHASDLPISTLSSRGMLIIGVTTRQWLGLNLPLDLGFLGAPGCDVLVAPLLQQPVSGPTGSLTLNLPIPMDVTLVGQTFYSQFMVRDANANAAGLTMTNGMATTIGIQ